MVATPYPNVLLPKYVAVCDAVRCSELHHLVTSELQRVHYLNMSHHIEIQLLKHTAPLSLHCDALQHTTAPATHCNTHA